MMTHSKLKIFEISQEFLSDFLKEGETKIVKFLGIPKDAKFVHSWVSDDNRSIMFMYEHATFSIHPEGSYIEKGLVVCNMSDSVVNEYIQTKWFKDKIRIANGRDDVTGNY